MRKTKIIALLIATLMIVSLLGCSTVKNMGESFQSERDYSLVGYDYRFILDGNTVTFKYIDVVSDSEIELIGTTLVSLNSQFKSFDNPKAGTITLCAKRNLTLDEFNSFVDQAEALIYDTIY